MAWLWLCPCFARKTWDTGELSERTLFHLKVAGKSNLITRLQLLTSNPSSITFVETTVLVFPERNLGRGV